MRNEYQRRLQAVCQAVELAGKRTQRVGPLGRAERSIESDYDPSLFAAKRLPTLVLHGQRLEQECVVELLMEPLRDAKLPRERCGIRLAHAQPGELRQRF